MSLKREFTETVEKSISKWFCGCEIGGNSGSSYYRQFEEEPEHGVMFDDKKVAKRYICHKRQKYMVEQYELVPHK